jgi:inosine-uridine nucleoside N-ribohydrolase
MLIILQRVVRMAKIIIDTDIGDDVDDSLAIALALSSPEIEVVGITTVFRQVRHRAHMAKAVAKAFGKPDIPVIEGVGKPLLSTADDLDQLPFHWDMSDSVGYAPDERNAVDFILDSLENNPEIVLVAIGPLTNIALACQKRPDIMEKAQLYAMGGMFFDDYPEWNFRCDPEAADIVLKTMKNPKLFGFQLTQRCKLADGDLEIIESSSEPGTPILTRMLKEFLTISNTVTLHDPCPILGIIFPDQFRYEAKAAAIELEDEPLRGVSKEILEAPNILVAYLPDPKVVSEVFMKRVAKAS